MRSFIGVSFGSNAGGHALIVYAGLVEGGVNETAGPVGERDDLAAHGHAVHMDIEDVHEDGQPAARLIAESQFGRRLGFHDGQQHAIGRTDEKMFALRWRSLRIAEEGDAPYRHWNERDTEPRRQPEQYGIGRNEQRNERPAFAVDRNFQESACRRIAAPSSASRAQRKRAAQPAALIPSDCGVRLTRVRPRTGTSRTRPLSRCPKSCCHQPCRCARGSWASAM